MKRILSLLVCAAIVVSGCCAEAFASERPDPVILISGFMCSQLFTDFGTENQKKVWGPSADKLFENFKDDFSGTLRSALSLFGENAEGVGEALGGGAEDILEELKCLPDGSSEYNISHYPNIPETSNVAYMLSDENGKYLYEKNFCTFMAERMGGDRVFCFQYDSRLDAFTIANELRDFIKSVKKYTGSEKVSLFALSYGGLISATYLTFFADDNDVGKAVLSVPALGGTDIPAKILRGDIDLSDESIVTFVETALGGSSNFARIFEQNRAEWLDRLCKGLSGGLGDAVKNWGSFWCLCCQSEYESLKSEFLDPTENKLLIEKTDLVHNEVMSKIKETFDRCRSAGIGVSIICGTGSSICTGGKLNGDVILPAECVSGAVCAPIGERFADGYKCAGTSCADPSHNHISPSMEIDASAAYLPENTWFVNGHYHGQYFYEEYTRSLVEKLLTTDDIKDVYSDPAYPQFENSNNAYRSVHLSFNSSLPGYISSEDTALAIENVTSDDYIKIISVISDGMKLDFKAFSSKIIAPGEKIDIPFEGTVPQESRTEKTFTVNFIRIGKMNPFRSVRFSVMTDNGEAPEYKGGTVKTDETGLLAKVLPERLYSFLKRASLRQSVECIYDTVRSRLD